MLSRPKDVELRNELRLVNPPWLAPIDNGSDVLADPRLVPPRRNGARRCRRRIGRRSGSSACAQWRLDIGRRSGRRYGGTVSIVVASIVRIVFASIVNVAIASESEQLMDLATPPRALRSRKATAASLTRAILPPRSKMALAQARYIIDAATPESSLV